MLVSARTVNVVLTHLMLRLGLPPSRGARPGASPETIEIKAQPWTR